MLEIELKFQVNSMRLTITNILNGGKYTQFFKNLKEVSPILIKIRHRFSP